MYFVKSVLVGIAVCAVTYFAIFALMMAFAALMPVAKFLAIGAGIWAMIYYQRAQ